MNNSKKVVLVTLVGLASLSAIILAEKVNITKGTPSTIQSTHSSNPAVAFQSQGNTPKAKSQPNTDSVQVRRATTFANYAKYETVDQLDTAADMILIGAPIKDFDDRQHVVTRFPDGTLQDFYTLTSIQVTGIVKKPTGLALEVGQTFQVVEPIGLVDEGKNGKVKIDTEGYREMKKGKTYILFLKSNGQDQFSVINMNSGKFNVDGTDIEDLGEKAEKDEKLKLKQDVLKKYDKSLK